MWADFILGGPSQRRRFVGSAKGPLARAVGVRGRRRHVFDATAGLGQDAFRLAMLGCKVTAVERSAIPAALLLNGIERARRVPELRRVFDARFRLLAGDSRDILRELFRDSPPDVVYLDPMFPPNRKSSPAVREEMRLLRAVVGDDPDADDVFRTAVDVAGERVVVKRLLHAAPLCEEPDYCIKGNIARYDVYLTNLESPAG